jgi:hypothetical protein
MLNRTLVAAVALFAAASASTTAFAQPEQNGLVNVTITDVTILDDFLNDDQIAILNGLSIPISVQAPIGIAATVCGVSAAILGQSTTDPVTCDATSGSQAFANLVNRQLLQQLR